MTGSSNGADDGAPRIPGREERKPLPKRFYREASAAASDGGWRVMLDGRVARTPGKRELTLPSTALAEAVAAEWAAQGEQIDPETMPLTRMANTAIDGVAGREQAVAEDIVAFSGSDLVCYRAESPRELVVEQAQAWNPVLEWARHRLGARFEVASGIVHVAQDPAALAAVAERLADLDPFRLTALHVMTTLTGSALIALAHADGLIDAASAWHAAHVDEDWQVRHWGEDQEAAERRRRRWQDMEAASRFLSLLS